MEVKNKQYCAYPWQQMIIDLTGEVVPCCFWSGYGNSGKPLGNTNINSIDEIWNGEGYQELRKANFSGDLKGHPCNQCMAYDWSGGRYPEFSTPSIFKIDSGFSFLTEIPSKFIKEAGNSLGDTVLLEDGIPLPKAKAIHENIRNVGLGQYSVWENYLYFSSSDNSSPVINNRVYELTLGEISYRFPHLGLNSVSGKNIVKAKKEYDDGIKTMTAKPSMISLISTADCNIDCPACSQNKVRLVNVQHRKETVPDVLRYVPFLHQFIWHGGEPYLIKKFREFVDEFNIALNPNLTFGFTSNGTMLSSKELDKLKKFPKINASISIDSFDAKTFEKIREGADFNKVIKNTLEAIKAYEYPNWVFSVGMIICKSNFIELPKNIKYAVDNDIGLNLSPVVIYPVTEQLDVFTDFHRQTIGWDDALEESFLIVNEAIANKKLAMRRVNSLGMLEAIKKILDDARKLYSNNVTVRFLIKDSYASLEKMRNPGIIIYNIDENGQPLKLLSYAEINFNQDECIVQIPRDYIVKECKYYFHHNLTEEGGVVALGDIPLIDIQTLSSITNEQKYVTTIPISLNKFSPPNRPKNIHYSNYGETTVDGLNVRSPGDISLAYIKITKIDELNAKKNI